MEVIDSCLLNYAAFLNRGWEAVVAARGWSLDDDIISTWAQANWEILVESQLGPGLYLPPYNGGADYHKDSSRVLVPSALPTHIVTVMPRPPALGARDVLSGAHAEFPRIGVPLEEFVSITEKGWFASAPPFTHVRVGDHLEPQVFPINEVTFNLRPILQEEL